ncbi:MAG: vWA domain-containing protein [Candidatus Thermoplasmatota archaeon]|nr:vWA domain-containing protein [Candidatus Thermoplasmatota archaeon]
MLTWDADVLVDWGFAEMHHLVYLDDSGSMSGQRLEMAKWIYENLLDRIDNDFGQVTLFDHEQRIALPWGKHSRSRWDSAISDWTGKGMTYLWKMVIDDVEQRKPDDLNIVIITDGYDNKSPFPYGGIKGIIPTVLRLLRKGYNGEIHIIDIGGGMSNPDIVHVCHTTGGMYYEMSGYDDSDKDQFIQEFLVDFIDEGQDSNLRARNRRDRQSRVPKGFRLPNTPMVDDTILDRPIRWEVVYQNALVTSPLPGATSSLRGRTKPRDWSTAIQMSMNVIDGYRYIYVTTEGPYHQHHSDERNELRRRLLELVVNEEIEAIQNGHRLCLIFEEKDDAQRMCGGGSNNLKNLGFVINRSERIEVRHN